MARHCFRCFFVLVAFVFGYFGLWTSSQSANLWSQSPWPWQVHLHQVKQVDWVKNALESCKEIVANLDQSPILFDHYGRHVPVVLASTSNMFGLLRSRPLTWKDRNKGDSKKCVKGCRFFTSKMNAVWVTKLTTSSCFYFMCGLRQDERCK